MPLIGLTLMLFTIFSVSSTTDITNDDKIQILPDLKDSSTIKDNINYDTLSDVIDDIEGNIRKEDEGDRCPICFEAFLDSHMEKFYMGICKVDNHMEKVYMGICEGTTLTNEEKDLQLDHVRHAYIHKKCMENMWLHRETCPLCKTHTNLIIPQRKFEKYIEDVQNDRVISQWDYVDITPKSVGKCLSRIIVGAFRRYKKDVIGIEMLVRNPKSVLLSRIVWLEVANRMIPGFHSAEYAICSACIYFLFRRLKNFLVYDFYPVVGVSERCVKLTIIFFRCLMLIINILFLIFRFTGICQLGTGEYDSDNATIIPILHIHYFAAVTSVIFFFAANKPKKHEMIARDLWIVWERLTYLVILICNWVMLGYTKVNCMQWILGIFSLLAGLLDTQSQWFMVFTIIFAFETSCLGEYGAGINYRNNSRFMNYAWILQFMVHLLNC